MALIKIGNHLWVEIINDGDDTAKIYNKTEINADITAINATLKTLPNPEQEASDMADLLAAIAGKWTPAKNTRIVALINSMYQAYQGDPEQVRIAQMIQRRDDLVDLRDRLV